MCAENRYRSSLDVLIQFLGSNTITLSMKAGNWNAIYNSRISKWNLHENIYYFMTTNLKKIFAGTSVISLPLYILKLIILVTLQYIFLLFFNLGSKYKKYLEKKSKIRTNVKNFRLFSCYGNENILTNLVGLCTKTSSQA